MTTKPVNYVADSHNDNSNILTLSGFTFSDEDNKGSGSNPVEESRVRIINKSFKDILMLQEMPYLFFIFCV